MSNNIIPKEQLTAYQRWELAAFDEERQEAQREQQDVAPSSAPVVDPQAVDEMPSDAAETAEQNNLPYPTAEEIEAIHQQAYQEAFGEGQKAGYERGFEQGLNEGRLAGAAEVDGIKVLFGSIESARADFEQHAADDLLQLALEVARQVVRREVRERPEQMLPVIREAISSLPQLNHAPRIHLHPADLAAVESLLGHEVLSGWCLSANDEIEQGGCRVEAGSSELDASLATRWRRIVAALGVESNWSESVQD